MKKINISLNKILIIVLVVLVSILSILLIIDLKEKQRIHDNMLKTYDSITYMIKLMYIYFMVRSVHIVNIYLVI